MVTQKRKRSKYLLSIGFLKPWVFFFCLLFFSSSTSLIAQVQKDTTILTDLLYKSLSELILGDADVALSILDSLEPTIEEFGHCKTCQISFYTQKASIINGGSKGDIPLAAQYARKAIVYFQDLKTYKPQWFEFLCLTIIEDNLDQLDLYEAYKYCNLGRAHLIDQNLASRLFNLRINNLTGIVFMRSEHYDQALEYFNQALSYIDAGTRAMHYNVLENIGRVNRLVGNYDTSIKTFLEVRDLRLKLEEDSEEALAYSYLSLNDIYFAKGNLDSATHYIQKFKELDQDKILKHIKLSFIVDEMEVLSAQGAYQSVIDQMDAEINSTTVVDDKSNDIFISSPRWFLYFQKIKMRAQLGMLKKDPNNLDLGKSFLLEGHQLLTNIDQSKMLYKSKLSASNLYQSIDEIIDILVEVYFVVHKDVNDIPSEIMSEVFHLLDLKQKVLQLNVEQHLADSAVIKLIKKTDALERILESRKEDISADSLLLLKSKLLAAQEAVVSSTVDSFYLLNSSTVDLQDLVGYDHLVSYFVMDEQLAIIEFNNGEGHIHVHPFSQDVRDSVARFTHLMGHLEMQNMEAFDLISEGHRLGLQLHGLLIEPIMNDDKNLIIYPGNTFLNLPFAALNKKIPDQVTNYVDADYLVTRKKYVVIPSLTIYQQLKANNKNKIHPVVTSFYDGETDERRSSLLPKLAYAKKEAEGIKEMVNGMSYSTENMTGEEFLSYVQNPGILNFGIHTVLNNESPKHSHLYLNQKSQVLLSELNYESINADVVIFNSCQSGFGEFEIGEGFKNMSTLFVGKGVSSIVSSSWKINDFVGSNFSPQFCNDIVQNGFTPLQSLRNYQKRIINENDPIYSHPYYWSGYQCLSAPNVDRSLSRPWYLIFILPIAWLVLKRKNLLGQSKKN